VAALLDRVIMQEIESFSDPLFVVELGGGAHPDRYHQLFARLLKEPRGHIDWVDHSPVMLSLAQEYLDNDNYRQRNEVIDFIEADINDYLHSLPNNKIDLAIMKYVFELIENAEATIKLLSCKLKAPGAFVATLGGLDNKIKTVRTNGRFLVNGKEYRDDELVELKDGDVITVKYFKVSGEPNSGYLEGAQTIKYYYSSEKLKTWAGKYGFEIFSGNWKEVVPKPLQEGEDMDQAIMILRKT
jgi:ubiquinone/menaquinone biosynthesis C-methylase UbiE